MVSSDLASRLVRRLHAEQAYTLASVFLQSLPDGCLADAELAANQGWLYPCLERSTDGVDLRLRQRDRLAFGLGCLGFGAGLHGRT